MGSPRNDIPLSKARELALRAFGPRAFCRKTPIGGWKEIGVRKAVAPFKVVVRGRGKTWREAFEQMAHFLDDNGIQLPESK